MMDLDNILHDLVELAQQRENAPDWALGLKLMEEVGEVSEVLLQDNGFIQHKQLDEDLIHEIADVFNVCTAILAKNYSHLPSHEIMVLLRFAVQKKGQKYKDLLDRGMNQ